MARWQDQKVRTQTISEFYGLGLDQARLDFVDVDVDADTALFVDPRALRFLDDRWAEGAVQAVQDFFEKVLTAVKSGNEDEGLRLLRGLREPNDTRLGLSRSHARGRGVGKGLSKEVWDALASSEAAKSGLLENLEDTALLIEGIGADRISDITTNAIRAPLIAYTQEMCELHEIPVEEVGTGPYWDVDTHDWIEGGSAELPVPNARRVLLVPKSIVRIKLDFDPGEYYRHYILTFLRDQELAHGTELVRLLKNGRKVVYKKDVAAKYRRKYGTQKQATVEITKENSEILDLYKKDKERRSLQRPPPSLFQIVARTRSELPDWDALLDAVIDQPTGKAAADAYHKGIGALFNALFWPDLINPKMEQHIHDGRKRLDIRYVNQVGRETFFSWLGTNYGPAPYIVVECKNYTEDPENPEIDQLVGRFSNINGKVGMLVFRSAKDFKKIRARCKDAAVRGQGFILPIVDDDLSQMVEAKKKEDESAFELILHDRFSEITA